MKALLILSAIFCVPFILMSLACGMILMTNPYALGKDINSTVLLIYVLILAVSVSVIFTSTILMVKYSPKIKKLEEAEADVRQQEKRLLTLIKQYNQLIAI